MLSPGLVAAELVLAVCRHAKESLDFHEAIINRWSLPTWQADCCEPNSRCFSPFFAYLPHERCLPRKRAFSLHALIRPYWFRLSFYPPYEIPIWIKRPPPLWWLKLLKLTKLFLNMKKHLHILNTLSLFAGIYFEFCDIIRALLFQKEMEWRFYHIPKLQHQW